MKLNLASTRLAFVLITLLVLHLIASAIIPQQGISEDQIWNLGELLGENYKYIHDLALDRIYYVPPFYILLSLLALNIIFGNIRRFRTILKTEKTLIKTRHIGSVIFHFSIVMVLLGIVLNFLYKSESVLAMTEGQQLSDAELNYLRIFDGPLYEKNYDRFYILLSDIDMDYQVNQASATAAHISIGSTNKLKPTNGIIYTNHPIEYNDLQFHLGLFIGYAPKIIIKDSSGHNLISGLIRLSIQDDHGQNIHRDFVQIEEHDMVVNFEIIPPVNETDSIPKLEIRVEISDNKTYIDTLRQTETIQLDEYKISFPELRRWCYISVISEKYLWVVFTGFWLALAGLAIGFIGRVMKNKVGVS